MSFKLGNPKNYTDSNSYAMKQWFVAVYNFITSQLNIATVTATYTVAAKVGYVRADATGGVFTVTVPLAKDNEGRRILIKKIDSSGNAVTVGRTSTDTFEGSSTKSLGAQWSHILIVSNGNNGWEII